MRKYFCRHLHSSLISIVPGKLFQPSLMLVVKPTTCFRVEHLLAGPFDKAAAFVANMRLDQKGLNITNTTAYYENCGRINYKVL
jgi:hypothetical protein